MRSKITFHLEKTIRFRYEQLTVNAKVKLIKRKIEPQDIRLRDIKWGVKKNAQASLLVELGYKIVFNYFYKDYLLIYNK